MINLSNQVAVITGGSRGIGAATAILLAQAGADIAIVHRQNSTSVKRVLREIRKSGRTGKAFKGAVEDSAQCSKLVDQIMDDFGKIDILVNSAGIWEAGEIGKMTSRNWQRTLDINLTGTFNMCNVIIPLMKRRRFGRIVNVSSTAGQRGEAFHSHYAASKGGIIAFTKSIATEVIGDGIWVNCVAPGWVETDMISTELRNKGQRKRIIETIPRGKIALPSDIAGVVLFLSSRFADHVVGEVINVNGGSVLCG